MGVSKEEPARSMLPKPHPWASPALLCGDGGKAAEGLGRPRTVPTSTAEPTPLFDV